MSKREEIFSRSLSYFCNEKSNLRDKINLSKKRLMYLDLLIAAYLRGGRQNYKVQLIIYRGERKKEKKELKENEALLPLITEIYNEHFPWKRSL